jgi:hypothetical protein
MAKKLTLGSLKSADNDQPLADPSLAGDDVDTPDTDVLADVHSAADLLDVIPAAALEAAAQADEPVAVVAPEGAPAEPAAADVQAPVTPEEESAATQAATPATDGPTADPLASIQSIADLANLCKMSKEEIAPEAVQLGTATPKGVALLDSVPQVSSESTLDEKLAATQRALSGQNAAPPRGKRLKISLNGGAPVPSAATSTPAQPQADADDTQTPATPEHAGKGAARGQGQPPQQMVAAGSSAGAGVADLVGRGLAMPFLALSSAARHLKRTHAQMGLDAAPATQVPVPAGEAMSIGEASALYTSGKFISQYKLDRIDAACKDVVDAADKLRATEDFTVWEDQMQSFAHEHGMPVQTIMQNLATDPDLRPLKEGMDQLWEKHPTLVGAYQEACDNFDARVKSVTKDYPNSTDESRERVSKAITKVVDETINLPGFGEDRGVYLRTIAERVREQLKQMMQLVERLLSKVGLSTGSELTP